jgi:hypothetical protein
VAAHGWVLWCPGMLVGVDEGPHADQSHGLQSQHPAGCCCGRSQGVYDMAASIKHTHKQCLVSLALQVTPSPAPGDNSGRQSTAGSHASKVQAGAAAASTTGVAGTQGCNQPRRPRTRSWARDHPEVAVGAGAKVMGSKHQLGHISTCWGYDPVTSIPCQQLWLC